MTLFRNSILVLSALTVCAPALWYAFKQYSSHLELLHTYANEQQALPKSPSVQSDNPFALIDRSVANTSTTKKVTGESTEVTHLTINEDTSQSLLDAEVSGCGLSCEQAIEALQLPYEIADHEYEEYLSLVDHLATYLLSNVQLREEFVEIALQADGNKRKIIMAAFALLPEIDRLKLGQALIESSSEFHRLDGVHVLASTESISQYEVTEFSELLQNEQNVYVRHSVIQALNRPELFKGDAKVLTILSQVINTESDASVRGEALFVSARLSSDPQPLLFDSFNAIRSEQSEYQHYGVRALEEIFVRHTRSGGQVSEFDRSQLEQLVDDLMEPEFDNMPVNVRRNIEDIFERFF